MFKALPAQSNRSVFLALAAIFFAFTPLLSHAEWNADWTAHSKISINSKALTEAATGVPVAVRLHSGNFDFTTANIDGSDLRFVAADDKTELKYFIEKYDSTNELAIVWVQIPKLDPAAKEAFFYVYSGNEAATKTTGDAKAIFDATTTSVMHFSSTALLQDSVSGASASGEVKAQPAGLLGDSATFAGKPITIAASPTNGITSDGGYTWSAWVKAANLPQTATLYSQGGVTLSIAEQKLSLKVGKTAVEGGQLKPAAWQHIAFTLQAGKANLYLDGAAVGAGDVTAQDEATNIIVGDAFVGEMDELEIANTAKSVGAIKLAESSQGADSKLISIAAGDATDEGEEEGQNYIGILIKSLTPDAKVVIAILTVMFAISVWVMWSKAMLVSKTDKDNKKFLARFQKATGNELLELDRGATYPNSNLYGLYQAGLREIKKREKNGELSLSGASMDAIKAAIDADLVRETQRQNAGMVLLTIAISGGPFLGLLGTVVGVMITFAAIAAAGDVNVNAIAPGIAAALLATVAGLGVAIPALFGYNYLASRIKNITIAMQIFVDEFVTRTAELFGRE